AGRRDGLLGWHGVFFPIAQVDSARQEAEIRCIKEPAWPVCRLSRGAGCSHRGQSLRLRGEGSDGRRDLSVATAGGGRRWGRVSSRRVGFSNIARRNTLFREADSSESPISFQSNPW